MIENKKILITGGDGYIGTELAKRLMGFNNVSLMDIDFSKHSPSVLNIIFADILDKEALISTIKDQDIIIHTAAMLGVQNVINNVSETIETNYSGTRNLLEAVRENGKCERIIIFSTSEVFGPNAIDVSEDGNSSLISIQNSRWCYSVSKLASEYIAMDYFRMGLPVTIVRPFNIFGEGRTGEYVVLQFILRALKNEDLEVYGDGNQIRSWCYGDDICDAILSCLEKDVAGEIFNIGNPLNTITIYRLAKLIVKMCNSKSKIVFKEIDFADVHIRIPNISKARKMLDFNPKVELEEGLERTIKWVRENYE